MKDEDAYLFWERVDDLRADLEIKTLKELSEITQIYYRRISDQRTNLSIPKAVDLLKLSKALGTSMEFLLTGKNKTSNYPAVIKKIADKLTLVSKFDLLIIERSVELLPIEESSKANAG